MATGATTAPPDGWSMLTGLWGTDAFANGVTTGTTGLKGIGQGGIIVQTAAATIVSNWVSLETTSTDIRYIATVKLTLPTNTTPVPTISFVQYAADQKTQVQVWTVTQPQTGYYSNGYNVVSIGVTASTSAPYGRWVIQSGGTGPVNIWALTLERIRPCLFLNNPTTTAIAASTWTPVTWSTSTVIAHEAGLLMSSGTNIALRKAGIYLFCVNVAVIPNSGTFAANSLIQSRVQTINSASSTQATASPTWNKYTPNATTVGDNISWSWVLDVPSMNVVLGTQAVPYYQVQLFCATSIKAVTAAGSLSIVSLN